MLQPGDQHVFSYRRRNDNDNAAKPVGRQARRSVERACAGFGVHTDDTVRVGHLHWRSPVPEEQLRSAERLVSGRMHLVQHPGGSVIARGLDFEEGQANKVLPGAASHRCARVARTVPLGSRNAGLTRT